MGIREVLERKDVVRYGCGSGMYCAVLSSLDDRVLAQLRSIIRSRSNEMIVLDWIIKGFLEINLAPFLNGFLHCNWKSREASGGAVFEISSWYKSNRIGRIFASVAGRLIILKNTFGHQSPPSPKNPFKTPIFFNFFYHLGFRRSRWGHDQPDSYAPPNLEERSRRHSP